MGLEAFDWLLMHITLYVCVSECAAYITGGAL